MRFTLSVFAIALLVGGSSVSPSVSALVMPAVQEREEQGRASAAGVHVIVKADAWKGQPADLTKVIPLLVTIASSNPIRLRYQEFLLDAPAGDRRAALPPFEIRGAETAPVGTVGLAPGPYPYPIVGFRVAPHLRRFYPRLHRFAGPFAFDPGFYSTYYPRFVQMPLPAATHTGHGGQSAPRGRAGAHRTDHGVPVLPGR